jgi:hypothetical protein
MAGHAMPVGGTVCEEHALASAADASASAVVIFIAS